MWVWILEEQIQIYRKLDPKQMLRGKKGGRGKHYFDNTYITCHSTVLLNCYCLVAF